MYSTYVMSNEHTNRKKHMNTITLSGTCYEIQTDKESGNIILMSSEQDITIEGGLNDLRVKWETGPSWEEMSFDYYVELHLVDFVALHYGEGIVTINE